MTKHASCNYAVEVEYTFDLTGTGGQVVERRVLIYGLFVPVDMRRQGLAREILANIIEEVKKSHKGLQICLYALPYSIGPTQDILIRFYESMGFQCVDSPPAHEQAGQLMVLVDAFV